MVRPVTIACVLVVSVAASACSPGRAAIVAGAAGMALGAYGLTRPDSQCSGSEAFCTNFADPLINEPINKTRDAASISMLVVGLGLVVVGLATEPSLRDEQKPTPPAPLVSARSTTFAPPATVRTPVDLALATRIENRLAIQASADPAPFTVPSSR